MLMKCDVSHVMSSRISWGSLVAVVFSFLVLHTHMLSIAIYTLQMDWNILGSVTKSFFLAFAYCH